MKKELRIMENFLLLDHKVLLTWVGSAGMVLLNKFGFTIQEYQLWKLFLLDGLTAISLLVAIGYTISRWRKLDKKKDGDS